MEDIGIIDSSGTEYELTLFGQLIQKEFTETWDSIGKLMEAQRLIEDLPPDLDLPTSLFSEGTILRSHPRTPSEPIEHVWDTLSEADECLALLPVMNPGYIRDLHHTGTEHGVQSELILKEAVLEILLENYESKLERMLDSEQWTLWATPRSIPVGLILIDQTTLWVGFYGGAGGLRGAINPIAEDAVSWGSLNRSIPRSVQPDHPP